MSESIRLCCQCQTDSLVGKLCYVLYFLGFLRFGTHFVKNIGFQCYGTRKLGSKSMPQDRFSGSFSRLDFQGSL